MFRAYKYRIYPTDLQKELISKHIGASRFVYNLALESKELAYLGTKHRLSCFDLINQLPDLKKECVWLKEINSQSLQQSIVNLDKAYTSFLNGQSRFPKFKKKSTGGSFGVPQKVRFKNNKIVLPKFKEGIEIVLHRPIKGDIKQATISKTPTGKYFVSILCETGEPVKPKEIITQNNSIGVDLGIKDFAITSKGEVFKNPKYLRKAQSKLKYVQRKYSKNKGKRTKQKLALLHEKVANKRKDFLHKVSTKLIRENQTICLEDLNIKCLMKNHKLSRAISDVGWGMFVNMLKYKSEWNGKNVLQIKRFAPSSKTCSCCGYINKELTLKDREWDCPKCNSVLERDVNAACNIKSFALKNYLSGEHTLESRDELPTLVGVMTSEAQFG